MKASLSMMVTVSALIGLMALPGLAQVGPGDLGGDNSTFASICTRNANGRLNLRAGPGQQYRIITQVANGVTVSVINSAKGRDGFIWHQVVFNNYSGWVRGDYLCS